MTAQKAGKEGRDSAILVEGFLVFTTLPSHRMLQARFQEVFQEVRIGDKMIKLVRGYFFNKIKTLNGKYYTSILPENTISPMPGFYLLPINRVPAFQKAKEELLEEYTIYEQELRDFLTYGKIPEGKRETPRMISRERLLRADLVEKDGPPYRCNIEGQTYKMFGWYKRHRDEHRKHPDWSGDAKDRKHREF